MGAEESKEKKKEATTTEIASTAFAEGLAAEAMNKKASTSEIVSTAFAAGLAAAATGSSNSNSNEYKSDSGYSDSDSNEKRMKAPGQKGPTIRRVDFEGIRRTSDSRGRSCPKLKCDHCGKDNHTIERCYRLHGFPPKNKQSHVAAASVQQSPIVAPSVESFDSTSSSTINSPAPPLSQEQYQHLLNLLTAGATPSVANPAGPINEEYDWTG